MDKKMFLAVLLSIGVIVGYYTLFPPSPPKEIPKQSAPASTGQPLQQASVSGPQTPTLQAGQPATASGPQAPAPRVSQPSRKEVAARQVVIDTPRYVARVDTRGGRLVSFKLKHYKASKTFINWVEIIPPLGAYLSRPPADSGELMEMIKNELREVDALDVSFVGEQKLSLEFRNVIFEPDRRKIDIRAEAGAPQRLVLTGSGKDGLTISKILTFYPDSYIVDYELRVINYGDAPRQLRVMSYLGEGPDTGAAEQNLRSFYGPVFREDGSVDTEDADDVEEGLIVRSPQWLGISGNYFITAAAPESRIDHAEFRSIKLITREGEEKWSAYYGIELPAVRLEPGNMIAGRMKLYMGPKKTGELKKFGGGLEDSIRQTFEWLGPLARGLLAILHWFQSFTGNYGVSIILLTVLVRVVLFPLTYKGMVSMRRMSKMQPKMKALREKFGDNKEALNKEMMVMYKRYKINPLGGCLPILVQMPIFFALYSALLTAIELRHAPFIWWIQDLSSMDHLFITPLLMGASMFIQQRLTPSSMDPAQQRILMFMPLIFMVFMFSFPSGLVLYWVTSNTLSILQQLIINRAHIPDLVESKS